MDIEELCRKGGFECGCGRTHRGDTKHVLIEKGAVRYLPELLKELGASHPFVLSGHDTFEAGGKNVERVLNEAGISFTEYVLPNSPVPATEETVGSVVMHFDYDCDVIIGVGSGVINDTGKIMARAVNLPYMIVATAPSMDGFASATSSMERDGLKVSLDSKAAWAVIGDLDILCNAPQHMLLSGVGDILAKYVSLAEWKIAELTVDEYYCPTIAAMVQESLDKVMKAAPGLLKRNPDAVRAVMEGMVLAGMAMKYAGLSRPASGMEHYFSHIWDMRALAFPEARSDLHGIQCGIGTLYSLKIYDYLRNVVPDKEHALMTVRKFSVENWNTQLRAFIGPGAEAMIEGETRQGKYDEAKHAKRLIRILDRWEEIQSILHDMPTHDEVMENMEKLGAPVSAGYLGYSDETVRTTFEMTKDIRDKYIGSRLLWDLGLLDSAAEVLYC